MQYFRPDLSRILVDSFSAYSILEVMLMNRMVPILFVAMVGILISGCMTMYDGKTKTIKAQSVNQMITVTE